MATKQKRIQTIGEEIANAISHGVGSLLSIAATAVLIVYAAIYSDALAVVSSALYGATLIILYTNSTLYHSLTNKTAKNHAISPHTEGYGVCLNMRKQVDYTVPSGTSSETSSKRYSCIASGYFSLSTGDKNISFGRIQSE